MITLQVGVKVFLKNANGQYLLLKRAPNKYRDVEGRWDIVGGRLNPGSTLIENLKREVCEETQLEIISEPHLLYAQDIILGMDRHVVRLTYVADTQGEPVLDMVENIEYKWLDIHEFTTQVGLDAYVREIVYKKPILL